jgi:cell wall-associated NlpC family hydrolase
VRLPAYCTEEARLRLYGAALSWVGTPFAAHADIKGAGVDCVNLAVSVYVDSGFIFIWNPPAYTLDAGSHLALSKVVEWLEASGKFDRVGLHSEIGDLLLFRVGGKNSVIHHVGVKVSKSHFIQAIRHYGVVLSPLADPTWAARLERVYRPMEGIFQPA